MSKAVKWNNNSKAHKELVKMLETGAVNPDQKPKAVYDNYPDLFDRYTIKQFSNAWIRLTGDQKVMPVKAAAAKKFKADDYDDDDDDEDSVLNFDSGCAPKKPRAGSSIATTTGQPTTVGYNQWCPIHSIIRWKDRMLREHITVAMALPSGLIADGLNGKFTPSVSNDGKILTVKCAWPNLLSDTDSMELGWSRQKGLTTRELVNMVVAAEQEIKDLRKHLGITRGDQLFSIATMKLPSECEREIVNMVTCSDRIKGGIVVYLVLKVRIEDTEEGDIDMSVQDISSLRTSGVSLSTKLTYDNIMSQALENFAENITPRAVPTKGLPKGNTRSSTTGKRKSKGTDKENYSGKSQNYM